MNTIDMNATTRLPETHDRTDASLGAGVLDLDVQELDELVAPAFSDIESGLIFGSSLSLAIGATGLAVFLT